MANILHIVRITTLVLTLLFSFIVLGLTAYITNGTESTQEHIYFTFALLSLIVSVISIVTVLPMLIVDSMRVGAFTSRVLVELVWLSILWVLWVVSAAETADFFQTFFGGSCGFINPIVNAGCMDIQAVMAFAFLAWLTLMGYTITLLVFAIISANRGHNPWGSTVKHGDLLGAGAGGAQPPPNSTTYNAPPSMQQHQYPPSGTPPIQGYPTPSPGPQSSVHTTAPQGQQTVYV